MCLNIFFSSLFFNTAPKVSKSTSRIKWGIDSCRDIQAKHRALDDYFPLWTLWHGTTVKLREMVMCEAWARTSTGDGVFDFNIGGTQKCCSFKESDSTANRENIKRIKSVVLSRSENNCDKNFEEVLQTSRASTLPGIIESHEADILGSHSFTDLESVSVGTVFYNSKNKTVCVRCKDNWVSFRQVVVKGKKPMSAHDFYNGFISKVPLEKRKFS